MTTRNVAGTHAAHGGGGHQLTRGTLLSAVFAVGVAQLALAIPAVLQGLRLPFIPPLGNAFAAWMDDTELENWLRHLPSEDARTDMRGRLAAVRNRGFSVILRSDAHQGFESMLARQMLARLAVDRTAADSEDLYRLIRELDIEPAELSPQDKTDIGVIRVPVFGPDGSVAMVLAVFGFPKPTVAGTIDAYIERIRSTGRRATELLGGRVPAIA